MGDRCPLGPHIIDSLRDLLMGPRPTSPGVEDQTKTQETWGSSYWFPYADVKYEDLGV